jgi:hypothetical protein
MTTRKNIIDRIAREALGLETLESRRMDSLDFYEHAVWSIQEALERAYEAGLAARQRPPAPPTTCPSCGRDIEITPT